MAAIAIVNHIPVHIEHTDVGTTHLFRFRATLFDPGGRGYFDVEANVTISAGQTGATISNNIATAIRSAAAAEGVTIGANALLMAQMQRI